MYETNTPDEWKLPQDWHWFPCTTEPVRGTVWDAHYQPPEYLAPTRFCGPDFSLGIVVCRKGSAPLGVKELVARRNGMTPGYVPVNEPAEPKTVVDVFSPSEVAEGMYHGAVAAAVREHPFTSKHAVAGDPIVPQEMFIPSDKPGTPAPDLETVLLERWRDAVQAVNLGHESTYQERRGPGEDPKNPKAAVTIVEWTWEHEGKRYGAATLVEGWVVAPAILEAVQQQARSTIAAIRNPALHQALQAAFPEWLEGVAPGEALPAAPRVLAPFKIAWTPTTEGGLHGQATVDVWRDAEKTTTATVWLRAELQAYVNQRLPDGLYQQFWRLDWKLWTAVGDALEPRTLAISQALGRLAGPGNRPHDAVTVATKDIEAGLRELVAMLQSWRPGAM